jgi:hypothetical protein
VPIFEAKCLECETVSEFYAPRYTENNPNCVKCGSLTERIISKAAFHDFYRTTGTTVHRPYTTRNIDPNGKEITITSDAQLRAECKKAGVTPAWSKESRIG